ncbi:hypothetical protein [Compostimonas suwonensis]|uniref:Uncharacterized protein n=1 Tax=Compostimonas suwonensis TaxID=1048394 RepID=A0A2M9C4V9_9MICO|nr:hypothetical protein [Compostimonas suwonensis]PJJ65563.1 hypothetical protein CLV54_0596 [Compostimonas suwonensis]
MGVFHDLFRLGRAGVKQSLDTDYAANLKQSADLAEQFAGLQPGEVPAGYGAPTANPFDNLRMHAGMIQGSGTVVALADNGTKLGDTTVYAVDLDITLPGQQPYRTVYTTVIAQSALPNWQPGSMITLRVSPTDPHSVMLG